MQTIPEITAEKLIVLYEVILFDAYGVLMHSTGALPGAVDLVDKLNTIKKPYFILTNDASSLPSTSAARFRSFGLKIEEDRIITSGSLLKDYFNAHQLVGADCVVLGPTDSRRYLEIAGGNIVSAADPFDVLVIGDEDGIQFLEEIDKVLTNLFHAFDRGKKVHLVLPNPDLIYTTAGGGFGITAGSIAGIFEGALKLRYPHEDSLRFDRLGKPHGSIFNEALRRSRTMNMVMIGDQLETDIRGANSFGIDSVLVGTGVNSTIADSIVDDMRPVYYLRDLLPSGTS